MKWQRNPDTKTTVLPDGYIALASDKTDWVHILNPVAALIWELSDGKSSSDEILSQIESIIQTDDKLTLEKEIESFSKEMLASGLIFTE